MDFQTRIKYKEYELIHSAGNGTGKRLSVFDLADKVNKSHSYLCRISSLTEDIPFPLELAVPIMKLKNNFNLLSLIAEECGYAIVKLPKKKLPRKEETELAAAYQNICSNASSAFITFLNKPDQASLEQLLTAMQTVIASSIEAREYAQTVSDRQLKLDF